MNIDFHLAHGEILNFIEVCTDQGFWAWDMPVYLFFLNLKIQVGAGPKRCPFVFWRIFLNRYQRFSLKFTLSATNFVLNPIREKSLGLIVVIMKRILSRSDVYRRLSTRDTIFRLPWKQGGDVFFKGARFEIAWGISLFSFFNKHAILPRIF